MTDSGGSAGSADASTSSVLHLLDASASASLPPPASPPTPQRTTAMASRQSSLSRQNAEEVLRLLMTDDIGLLSDTVQTPPLRHHSPVELTPQPISPPAATAPSAAPSAATATAPSVTASAPLASTSGGSGSSSSLSLSSSASAVLAPRAAAPGSGRLHVYYGERQQSLSLIDGLLPRESLLTAFSLPANSDIELRDKAGEPVDATALHRQSSITLVVRRTRRRPGQIDAPADRTARAFPSTSSSITSPLTPVNSTKGQRLLNALLAGPGMGVSTDFNASDSATLAEFDAAWEELKRGLKRSSGAPAMRRSVSLTDVVLNAAQETFVKPSRPRSNTLSSSLPLMELKLTLSHEGIESEPVIHAEYGPAEVKVVRSNHAVYPCFGLTLGRIFARKESVQAEAQALPPGAVDVDGDSTEPGVRSPGHRMLLADESMQEAFDSAAKTRFGGTGSVMVPNIIIKAISYSSPAEHAGLRVGDMLYSVNDQSVPVDSVDAARAMLSDQHGKVVFEISPLLQPSADELVKLLEPLAPAPVTATSSKRSSEDKAGGGAKLHDFFGEDVENDLSDIIRTGHVTVKHVLSGGGKTLLKRPWKEYFAVLKKHVLYFYADKDKMEGAFGSQPAGGLLSVKNSLCDIAHGYKKRPHVFKIQAYNGAECLVQAESDRDMREWLRVIMDQSNPDNDTTPSHELIKRKAKEQLSRRASNNLVTPPRLSQPELSGDGGGGGGAAAAAAAADAASASSASAIPLHLSQSAGASGGGASSSSSSASRHHNHHHHHHGSPHNLLNRLPVGLLRGRWPNKSTDSLDLVNPFTTSLEDQCRASRSNVPMFLRKVTEEIERRGLDEEGLYRITGGKSQVEALTDAFVKEGEGLDLTDTRRFNDHHALCSLTKKWIRCLPEPITTFDAYDRLIYAVRLDSKTCLPILKTTITSLPPNHRSTLRFLCEHLAKIVQHAAKNKMTATNMAVVFAPTLFKSRDESSELRNMSEQNKLVETLINYHTEICSSEPTSPTALSPPLSPALAPTSPTASTGLAAADSSIISTPAVIEVSPPPPADLAPAVALPTPVAAPIVVVAAPQAAVAASPPPPPPPAAILPVSPVETLPPLPITTPSTSEAPLMSADLLPPSEFGDDASSVPSSSQRSSRAPSFHASREPSLRRSQNVTTVDADEERHGYIMVTGTEAQSGRESRNNRDKAVSPDALMDRDARSPPPPPPPPPEPQQQQQPPPAPAMNLLHEPLLGKRLSRSLSSFDEAGLLASALTMGVDRPAGSPGPVAAVAAATVTVDDSVLSKTAPELRNSPLPSSSPNSLAVAATAGLSVSDTNIARQRRGSMPSPSRVTTIGGQSVAATVVGRGAAGTQSLKSTLLSGPDHHKAVPRYNVIRKVTTFDDSGSAATARAVLTTADGSVSPTSPKTFSVDAVIRGGGLTSGGGGSNSSASSSTVQSARRAVHLSQLLGEESVI